MFKAPQHLQLRVGRKPCKGPRVDTQILKKMQINSELSNHVSESDCSARVYYCVTRVTSVPLLYSLHRFFLQRINRTLLNPFPAECVEWNSRIVVFW